MKEQRVNHVLKVMKDKQIPQLLISDPLAIYYLTGKYIDPGERFVAIYLSEKGNHKLFVNKLFLVPEDLGIEKLWHTDTEPVLDQVAMAIDHEQVLGVDKNLPARFLLPLIDKGAASHYVNGSSVVDGVRGCKDEEEKEKMRAVSKINDAAIDRFKTLIKAGVTEIEVANQLLSIYKELGADDFSFEPLVAFGRNAAEPHHSPDGTVIKEGDCVLFDVGCKKDMYCADMTRTFFYKSVSDHSRSVYETVLKANEAAIAKLKPGMRLSEVDFVARDLISQKGYGEFFNHRLGHFIGLDVHEFGDVSAVNDNKVEEGMIFSIEPGIYLQGDVGVRIEDLVLVTADGCERLNLYSKELEILD